MAKITLNNIQKVFEKNIIAVNDFSMEIKDKEMVVLLGPSGCGKSTLLRMIAGLTDITEGQLFIGDNLVNDVSTKDRDISMVFQNYALYPHMSVFQNISFGLELRNYNKIDIQEKVDQVANILNISELLNRKPKELSGGQQQRVALGRAIVRDPKVFLFDEPLSNLDSKLRIQMRSEISKLHERLQATMIYVTHDQIEAMTMGERIVVMKDGVIQQIDTPLNLYNSPKNEFVAGFIGNPAMNLMHGEFINNGELLFDDGGCSFE
ncbi:ATP-binding cassette domain-containing protein, partial [bacterium]|nr:ATP-binding cassette domain-containing protein [bacterium]